MHTQKCSLWVVFRFTRIFLLRFFLLACCCYSCYRLFSSSLSIIYCFGFSVFPLFPFPFWFTFRLHSIQNSTLLRITQNLRREAELKQAAKLTKSNLVFETVKSMWICVYGMRSILRTENREYSQIAKIGNWNFFNFSRNNFK